jgi:hypothetical protein
MKKAKEKARVTPQKEAPKFKKSERSTRTKERVMEPKKVDKEKSKEKVCVTPEQEEPKVKTREPADTNGTAIVPAEVKEKKTRKEKKEKKMKEKRKAGPVLSSFEDDIV